MAKSKLVIPPEDITGEALEEWNRICDSLKSVGRPIKEADRSVLALYCRTWIVNRRVFAELLAGNPVATYSNDNQGPSPQYKIFKETTQLLRNLLSDLGCTPASRDFDAGEKKAKGKGTGRLVF